MPFSARIFVPGRMLHCSLQYVSKSRDFRGVSGRSAALSADRKSHLHFKGLRSHGTRPSLTNCLNRRARRVQGEGPIVSGMAGRYAIALFELARDEKAVDATAADLDRFEALVTESPDLARLVRSPVFSAGEQARALAAVPRVSRRHAGG